MEKYFKKFNKIKGFTLIEMMIAIAVFTIVITIGTGSLLNAYRVYNKSQDMRAIMDSINFTMEDMSKSIRTGSEYELVGKTFSFKDQYGVLWSYQINSDFSVKKIDSSGNVISLNDPKQIKIDPNLSEFILVGENPLPDLAQPFVSIVLSGTIISKGNTTPFYLRTSVSQRLLDSTTGVTNPIIPPINPPDEPTNPISKILPLEAKFCAEEGKDCEYDSAGTLYYGNDESYYAVTQVNDGGKINCNLESFILGTKIPGAVCFFESKSSSPDKFVSCANNKELCVNVIDKDTLMFYGADINFYTTLIQKDIKKICDIESFSSDAKPIENARCYIKK